MRKITALRMPVIVSIDDEMMLRELMVDTLNMLGFEQVVALASSGEFIEYLDTHDEPDLLMCDQDLGYNSLKGSVLIGLLRSIGYLGKILTVSGDVTTLGRDHFINAGANDTLQKGYEIAELDAAVRKQLGEE